MQDKSIRQGNQYPGVRCSLSSAPSQSSISVSRTNDTASRFNRLGETQKKAIILLANEAAQRFKDLPSLTHSHLTIPFEQFSSQDKASLMLGIKRLAELAAALPEFDRQQPRL